MDESYSLSLALVDFIPNVAFLVGAFYVVRLALLLRGRPCSRMAMAGALLVFLGGMLKAAWKLIYTTTAADLHLMSELQFALLAPGFVALLVTAILMARDSQALRPGAALLIAGWKIPLLAIMTISSIGANGILTYVAFRRGARLAGALLVVSVLCLFAMGGMAGGDQTVARQWIEEGINATGQIAFAVGSLLLYRAVASDPPVTTQKELSHAKA